MKSQKIKKCHFCGEEVLAIAKKCKHCGEWIDHQAPEFQKKMMECPFCAEEIEDGTEVCPLCEEPIKKQVKRITDSSIAKKPKKKKSKTWAAILGILFFILWLVWNLYLETDLFDKSSSNTSGFATENSDYQNFKDILTKEWNNMSAEYTEEDVRVAYEEYGHRDYIEEFQLGIPWPKSRMQTSSNAINYINYIEYSYSDFGVFAYSPDFLLRQEDPRDNDILLVSEDGKVELFVLLYESESTIAEEFREMVHNEGLYVEESELQGNMFYLTGWDEDVRFYYKAVYYQSKKTYVRICLTYTEDMESIGEQIIKESISIFPEKGYLNYME